MRRVDVVLPDTMTRYTLDTSTHVIADGDDGLRVLGGSPLRLFRLSAAGRAVFRSLEAGAVVAESPMVDRLVDAGAIHPVPPHPSTRFSSTDVTVVIPAHHVPPGGLDDIVARCEGTAGIVVVDDASDPPISTPNVPGASDLRMIRLDRNGGPAAARNAGVERAQTLLVAFVDADVELAPGWLAGLLGHFDDDRVGLVAPRVAGGASTSKGDRRVARYERDHSPLDLGGAPGRIAVGTRVSYVPAAALVVRAAAWESIGGFDESLRCGEDVDLVWRLGAAGWRCRYDPSVTVHHRPRPSWCRLAAQRMAYGASAGPLAHRHGSAVAPVRTSGWSLGVWVLVALGRPVAALALATATSVALVGKLPGVPARVAVRLAGSGHLYAGRSFAEAARRAWWPLLALATIRSRRARWATVAAALPALVDGGPWRVFDDAAYCVGLWRGALTNRTVTPLLPVLSSWPGRRTPSAPGVDDER